MLKKMNLSRRLPSMLHVDLCSSNRHQICVAEDFIFKCLTTDKNIFSSLIEMFFLLCASCLYVRWIHSHAFDKEFKASLCLNPTDDSKLQ